MAEIMNRSTMGNGVRSYRVVEGWAKFPAEVSVGYTHGIEVDKQDNIYVFHTGKPCIVKFDNKGNFLSAWGEEFEGGAHGFYLHQEEGNEYLYITDTKRSQVVKMDLQGNHLLTLGTPDRPDLYDGDKKKYVPTDVAVAPNGDIYAADGYGQSWIHHYAADGTYIRSWGGKGNAPGQLSCPHGISIDMRSGEPEAYVADRGNHRIQVFSLEGELKRIIADDLDMPCNFYYHGEEVYFPDLHSRVTIFDRHDRLICHLGEDQQAYKQDGWPNLSKPYYRANKFSSPHGVCVDPDGNVYVAEWIQDGRITKLERM